MMTGYLDTSPLTQGRGLKHPLEALKALPEMSPLTQGRGLKLGSCRTDILALQSPLTQGRGLKRLSYYRKAN